MTTECNVCGTNLGQPIYSSPEGASITTMCTKVLENSSVFFCEDCGHLQTSELNNLEAYYAEEYEINLHSETDDQIYEVDRDKVTYRTEKQAEVTVAKVQLENRTRILDFGCAKASTLKEIVAQRPNVIPHAFDVTDKYIEFWDKFIDPSNRCVFETPREWNGKFDVAVSYFALEHIPGLRDCLQHVHRLLRDGGEFLFMVPNVFENIADFVVADHVNHFSETSIRRLMSISGFGNVSVDASSYRAAFVVTGTKTELDATADRIRAPIDKQNVLQMAEYWAGLAEKIGACDALEHGTLSAIYGAGFYGNYILSCLDPGDHVRCFLDQNEQLQGRRIGGLEVINPEEAPEKIGRIYVGLNPKSATQIIADTPIARKDEIEFVFL